MKLFGRTGGYYLFWTGFVYFWVGMYLAFTHAAHVEYASAIWVCVLALPFAIPPLGRYLNMSVEWDKKMFNWFNKDKEPSNVIPFPDHRDYGIDDKDALPLPETKQPAPRKESKTYYTMGLTDDNRVSLIMGYTTLTMNDVGVQQLIDQLEFFKNQLVKE